jgi:SAM-dependent methyltransferase
VHQRRPRAARNQQTASSSVIVGIRIGDALMGRRLALGNLMTKSVLKIAQRIAINELLSTGMNQSVPEKLQQEGMAHAGSWNLQAKYAAATEARQGLARGAGIIRRRRRPARCASLFKRYANQGSPMTSNRVSTYPLATGEIAAARLALIECVCGPPGREVMRSLGVLPGMRVADIGCGTGETTRWFASLVGQRGEVAAVDFSADQLRVTRKRLDLEGHRNVRLIEASAYSTGLPKAAFDIVHCRFLLCHLERPAEALEEMASLVKPGGRVVCTDFDVRGMQTYPPVACYARMRELIATNGRGRKVDYEIGVKLPSMLASAGLANIDVQTFQPAYLRGEEKRLWEYTFMEASPTMVAAGYISAVELAQLARELEIAAEDERIMVVHPLYAVSWGERPRSDRR